MKNFAALALMATLPAGLAIAQGWVVDPSFNVGTGAADPPAVNSVVLQPDGSLLVGGYFELFDGVPRLGLVKLASSGDLDLGFDADISGSPVRVEKVLWMPDGRIIIGGQYTAVAGTPRDGLARLMPSGVHDVSLEPEASGWIWACDVNSANELFVGGNLFDMNLGISHILLMDEAGASLAMPPMGLGDVILTQPDDHVLVGSRDAPFMLRLMPDGSIDPTFTSAFGTDTEFVYDLWLQADGHVVVCGEFLTVDGTPRSMIARLNADGSLDPSFDPGTGFDDFAFRLLPLPDGDLLVSGDFTSYNGAPLSGGLVRLNPDGTLEASYPATGIRDMVLQPDGKLVLVGFNLNYDGANYPGIVRLMPDLGTEVPEQSAETPLVYPNPARDVLIVEWISEGTCQWSVEDALGRPVIVGSVVGRQMRVPVDALASGAYALRITDQERSHLTRFIKE